METEGLGERNLPDSQAGGDGRANIKEWGFHAMPQSMEKSLFYPASVWKDKLPDGQRER